MRTFLVRGALITFFAITGLFGSAATVQMDGLNASVDSNSASAAQMCIFKPYLNTPVNAPCEMKLYEGLLP